MAQHVNTALRAAALLAIVLLPAVSSAAEGAKPDPFIDAVLDCHGDYATDYTSIANTTTQIADRAEVRCAKQWEAYGRDALARALAKVAEPAGAEALKTQYVTDFKATVRKFTVETAIIYGASAD